MRAFATRVVRLRPGTERAYAEPEWADALVLVARGAVELEQTDGRRWRFGCGDVLWLAGLPLRALHASHPDGAVLLAISRAR